MPEVNGRLTCYTCGADLGSADDPYRDPDCMDCLRAEYASYAEEEEEEEDDFGPPDSDPYDVDRDEYEPGGRYFEHEDDEPVEG